MKRETPFVLSEVEPKARPSSKGDPAAACFDYAIAFGDGSLSTNGGGVCRLSPVEGLGASRWLRTNGQGRRRIVLGH
jgi:hypothetical protein